MNLGQIIIVSVVLVIYFILFFNYMSEGKIEKWLLHGSDKSKKKTK